ncbi:rod shape-determining protein MreD [Sphingomonas sp. NIBR02145]|uniref:rod shape-determining protein MreD n=1 Tax=Sphingomonas sp. NIBR02145 TaxID=3014784 RepID=UPI0022B34AE2|nr:rod shape-determining protein MreD [Sphingomonas sp. NIBR02145]WHU03555.1 rod shape-determining protein MreD [Sphingomonas sp. NIBR02145]
MTDYIPLGRSEKIPRSVWLAPLSVVLGSMTVLLPIIATVPFLPPFGLMMLLGWRLVRGDAMKVWMPVPLGFVDDMLSGQPLGSAMVLWTLAILMVDVLDTRLVWRDFWQDWLIASAGIGLVLIGGRLLATPFSAHVDTALLLQIVVSAALFPVIARFCAWLDRDKKRQ